MKDPIIQLCAYSWVKIHWFHHYLLFTCASGAIRPGLVFDGISAKGDAPVKGSHSNSSFGSRPPVRIPTLGSKLKPKQGLIKTMRTDNSTECSTGKENVLSNYEGTYACYNIGNITESNSIL